MTGTLLLNPKDDWNGWLDRMPHDIYSTSEYHSIAEQMGEGQALMAVHHDGDKVMAWPFLLRDIPSVVCPGFRDVTSVYGYSGPLAVNCEPGDPFLETAAREIADVWTSLRVVSVFARFHPLLDNSRWSEAVTPVVSRANAPVEHACGDPGLVMLGQTVSIDLTLPEDGAIHQYGRILRQEIQQARRRGVSTTIDEDWSALDDFLEIYHSTMDRNHAADSYYFPREYFDRLRERLGNRCFLAVARYQGQVAAACTVLECNGILQAHLGGPSPRHLKLSPFKELFDSLRQTGKSRGNSVMHIGGGRGAANDSLFAFKARFSPRRHSYYVGRWVLDQNAYNALCEERRTLTGFEEADSGNSFFPAYRVPSRAGMEMALTASGHG